MYKILGEHINEIPKSISTILDNIKSKYENQAKGIECAKLSFDVANYQNGMLMMLGYLDHNKEKRLGKAWGWEDIYIFSPNYKEMYYAQIISKKGSEPIEIYYNDKKNLNENNIEYDWFKKHV